MRASVGLAVALTLIFLAAILQMSIPCLKNLGGAPILLVPMIFCYAALWLPMPAALAVAFFTGLISDLMYLHAVGQVEIALGWSIVYFVFFCCLAQGFRPSFRRGSWWIACILSLVCTSLFLALQFAMLSLRRTGPEWNGFVFNQIVVLRILVPGVLAAILTPFVHFAVRQINLFFPQPVGPRIYGA